MNNFIFDIVPIMNLQEKGAVPFRQIGPFEEIMVQKTNKTHQRRKKRSDGTMDELEKTRYSS